MSRSCFFGLLFPNQQFSDRNHFQTDDELCPVKGLAEVFKQFPERWQGSTTMLLLFRRESGEPIQRGDWQQLLRTAAVATGMDSDRVGPHERQQCTTSGPTCKSLEGVGGGTPTPYICTSAKQ